MGMTITKTLDPFPQTCRGLAGGAVFSNQEFSNGASERSSPLPKAAQLGHGRASLSSFKVQGALLEPSYSEVPYWLWSFGPGP